MRNTLSIQDVLLVSSPNNGGLTLLRGDLSLRLSHDDATGLAAGRERIAWCRQQDGTGVLRMLQDGRIRSITLSDQPLDLHDLHFDGQHLYVACTQTNEVLQLGSDMQIVERWTLPGEPDAVHINSIAIDKQRVLASIFGRFQEHRGYKGHTRGAGEVIDLRSGQTLIGGLSQPHSVRLVGKHLYLCNSEENELRIYDGATLLKCVTLPGYTRGLVVTSNHVYVGLSRSRNDPDHGTAGRFETATVAVLDRKTLAIRGYVPVAAYEIYDIVAVPEVALAYDLAAVLWEEERAARDDAQQTLVGQVHELIQLQQQAASLENRLNARLQHAEQEQQRLHAVVQARDTGLREHQAAYKDVQERLAQAEQRERSLAAQAQQWEREIERLRGAVSTRDASLKEHQAASKDVQDRLAQVVQQERSQTVQMQQLTHEVERLRELIAKRDANLKEQQAAHKDVQERLAQAGQREKSQTKQMQHLEHEVERLRGLIATRDASLKEQQSARKDVQERLTQAVQRERSQTAQAQQLEREVERLRGVVAARDMAARETLKAREVTIDRLMQEASARSLEIQNSKAALVSMTARAARLQLAADELDLVKGSRSWKITAPLRGAMRILRKEPATQGFPALPAPLPATGLAALTPIPARAGADATPRPQHQAVMSTSGRPLPDCGEPSEGVDDVYIWGVIDWNFRIQRPQHLAQELARAGRRVFYISNSMVDRAQPGFRVEPLDDSGRLFQVNLFVAGRPVIYHGAPAQENIGQLRDSMALLLGWTRSRTTVSLVQHPYWLQTARLLPSNRLVYDCMDHHGGFENNSACVLDLEHALMRQADLLVLSSGWLEREYASFNANRIIVRNAGEYAHFSKRPDKVFADPKGRKVIGYYGAIAEWFDTELVRAVALAHPDCLVLLIGRDSAGVQEKMSDCANVEFTGEVAYADLPFYLYGFDVCLLPFQIIPLTLATNPVKIYEYLGAGKTVVSVVLPEIMQFGDLVALAGDAQEFVRLVGESLARPPSTELVQRRRHFAAEQTWGHRTRTLLQAIDAIAEPSVSVVVLTYNNLDYTKACLDSLERYSHYPGMDVIVVDNASSDGTQPFLQEWQAQGPRRRIILSAVNTGFAAGNNLGLQAADGDYLVMLNNDTYVTPGWVRTLIGHLRRDPTLGLVGPVTDNIGNEARIEISSPDMPGMIEAAGEYTRSHPGQEIPMRTLAFFCVAMRRSTFEAIGPLDEAFGTGFFEDDDYCRRAEAKGLRIACAEDVFVHHHLSATFNQLKLEQRKALFDQNKQIYEAKWGEWIPHSYRNSQG